MSVNDVPPGMLVVFCARCGAPLLDTETDQHEHQPTSPDEEFWMLSPLGAEAQP